ncbi:MAG: indolepyruvate ferredoxin oxidoreductase subunit alpha, partial [Methanomassiliicoccaceae archaeon]|nr:indolepyruvate ferredoxin oxidoreductase subunit alpha [Methanomassiliicoccaceae archaeon]
MSLNGSVKKELLLGNDAITRGVIEAGVGFASTYPGTPSSEIGNNLEKIGHENNIFFEFSANEKVAMESASAAAMSGVRSFVFMKHVGVNVAADPMLTLAYGGIVGGMVILTADDPSAHSSQNEQDNRHYSKL